MTETSHGHQNAKNFFIETSRGVKIHDHNSQPGRLVARNSKIELFRENKVFPRKSISALFPRETAADDYFPEKRMKTAILKKRSRRPYTKNAQSKRESC